MSVSGAKSITVGELIAAIELRNGFPLNQAQRDAVSFGTGPLWIIAGPGTGKTEVLVARCLKLVCCDGIAPKAVMATTFTEKAALSLQQRITELMAFLKGRYPQLSDVDLAGLRIGTLHALCNDTLQEYRYDPYRNLRLLDEVESTMLVRARIAQRIRAQCPELVNDFRYLFGNRPQPSLWDLTKGMVKLLARVVEDDLDIAAIRNSTPAWRQVAEACDLYDEALAQGSAIDFTRLQRAFLSFLSEPIGQAFVQGDGTANKPPLLYVLVDEYQDTNPIQEQIYLKLADTDPHNVSVVGDDDQALYRFRGGSVEAMVDFGGACQALWGVLPQSIQLRENYRSHDEIVEWCDRFISQSPGMQFAGARAQGKLSLIPASGRADPYPAVGFIEANTVPSLASAFAKAVLGLRANQIVEDYSQCVLLLRSARETQQAAGPYVAALQAAGVPYYNPRSRSFAQQPEVAELLGTLIGALDPGLALAAQIQGDNLQDLVSDWVGALGSLMQKSPQIASYVANSNQSIGSKGLGEEVTPAVPTILYRILSLPPFADYQRAPERDLRLSKVSRLLEAFCAQQGRRLRMDASKAGQVNGAWMTSFYYVFCGYLSEFGIDDDEQEDAVLPPDRVSVMTIHQAKGLEFDFVFVGNLGRKVSVGDSIRLETECAPFRTALRGLAPATERAWQDETRSHYVAYSRARQALILLATTQQLRKKDIETASFGAGGGSAFRRDHVILEKA